MKIKLNSIMVDNQDNALRFYTEILGFKKKTDIPMGEFSWLTVVSPEEPEGTELVLEPNANPAALIFQKAMFEQGIPMTAFEVEDIGMEHERLKNLGVVFRSEPVDVGTAIITTFDDTCGNLIQIYQVTE